MNQNTLYEKDFIAWIKQQAQLLGCASDKCGISNEVFPSPYHIS